MSRPPGPPRTTGSRSPAPTPRRIAALGALALPAIIVALVALVLMSRRDGGAPCPEVDVQLGNIAEGPRRWTARARYEQWNERGQCLGSLGVSFFAPGDSWEDEAWAPAAHVVVRSGLLPPPTRERAWTAWGDDGRPLLFGFGPDATPLLVDALPDAAGGLSVRRCGVIDRVHERGDVDWPRATEGDGSTCVLLRAE